LFKSVKEVLKAHEKIEREVYLDLENSTPIFPEVVKEMLLYFYEKAYGNPTLTHKQGWEAYEAILEAAQTVAQHLGSTSPEEINFMGSEVEANNLALLGVALAYKDKGRKIVISNSEPITIDLISNLLIEKGFKVVKVPVDGEGFIKTDELLKNIDKETILVSLATVNPEIGTIQPIKEIVEGVKEKNPETIFHTDASDAYGRIAFNVKNLNVDLATLSSYKIQGPRGVSVLYVKEGVKVERLLEGPIGFQQFWLGVENTPLIIGFKKASEICFKNFPEDTQRMRRLRDKLIDGILESVDNAILNGPRDNKRAPDNVNISFLRCEGEALTIELSLRGVYVSSGSACTRRMLQPSHILMAIGRKHEEAHGSILMKISRRHSEEDISYVLEQIPKAVERLRSLSPT
jgi:cysteine desulfurase